jgi:hypothetical protein
MPVLNNARHEKFAQNVVNGMSASAAYKAAGYEAKDANVTGPRMFANVGIKARIEELKAEAAKTEAITREEIIQFLADVVKTPAGHVHKLHPLCQSFKDTEDCNEIRMPDKLAAVTQICKMTGWNEAEKIESKLEILVRKL